MTTSLPSHALTETIADYLRFMRIERQSPATTLQSYTYDLKRWVAFLSQHALSELHAIQPTHIRAFILALRQEKISPKSIQRMLSTLKSFFGYMLEQGVLSVDPSSGIRGPKVQKRLPKTLDVDQIRYILDQPAITPIQIRDHAILELFYSSGLRLSELIALNLNDIDAIHQGLLNITGKGQKERVIPVGSFAKQAIAHWYALRMHIPAPGQNALFISLTPPYGRLTPRAIQYRLKNLGLQMGLAQPLHPHVLRHCCASHLLAASENLPAVQSLLGHTHLATTQMYTQLDFQHLSQIYDKAHPRAHKKKDKQ
jgi:integrase/recombinase XerC